MGQWPGERRPSSSSRASRYSKPRSFAAWCYHVFKLSSLSLILVVSEQMISGQQYPLGMILRPHRIFRARASRCSITRGRWLDLPCCLGGGN